MTIDEFYDCTPKELTLVSEAYAEARNEQYRQLVTQAYMTANWSNAKKLPKLDSILKKLETKKVKVQTDEEMFNMVKVLNQAFGGD